MVTDFVEVGVSPALPVKGVSFILGDDLAGGMVIPSLEVVDSLLMKPRKEDLFQKYLSALSTCAVTCAQAKKENNISLSDSFFCTDV